MSIPRRVVVGDTALEIRCIVEITHIKYADLRSIRRIPPEAMKKKFVFFGSYGFFGYYGYYIDGKSWETLKLYCKQWDNFIEITDAYEKRYIISSPGSRRPRSRRYQSHPLLLRFGPRRMTQRRYRFAAPLPR